MYFISRYIQVAIVDNICQLSKIAWKVVESYCVFVNWFIFKVVVDRLRATISA
jgi:hypothetical protein